MGSLFLSACESGFVSIWEVPDGGLTEIINNPSVVLKGYYLMNKFLFSGICCLHNL